MSLSGYGNVIHLDLIEDGIYADQTQAAAEITKDVVFMPTMRAMYMISNAGAANQVGTVFQDAYQIQVVSN